MGWFLLIVVIGIVGVVIMDIVQQRTGGATPGGVGALVARLRGSSQSAKLHAVTTNR